MRIIIANEYTSLLVPVSVLLPKNKSPPLLSPTLEYKRQVVTCDQFKWFPESLCLDVQRRRLYVAENERKNGKCKAGRVVVFSV